MDITPSGSSPFVAGRADVQPRREQNQQQQPTQTETAVRAPQDSAPSKSASGGGQRGQNLDITV